MSSISEYNRSLISKCESRASGCLVIAHMAWHVSCGPSDMRPSLPASDQNVSCKQVLLVSARPRARKLDCYALEQLASAD